MANHVGEVIDRVAIPQVATVGKTWPCDSELTHVFDWYDFNQVTESV